ncbi:MAG: hypothetical protein N2V71_07895 [Methanophagales archaeon]|nr:hypothetical protein [Methanophagales archaeon]MCW3140501.1 hypothetical protein [Methanophagales archaeon]MCW7070702.1 hypothetical protein [Methanophagales archaeon]
MSEIRPGIRIIKDVGYRVILKKEDGSPRLVWRGFVKEGQYGKFISIEQHWVRSMQGGKIVESDFGKKRFNFPYDKDKAFAMLDSIRGLVEDAFSADAGAGAGTGLEKEVEEEFGDELEGLEEEF